ncbi:MAG: uracil-DNA glycosylase [SAR116 cluster bacterium MED-G06]|nr:MAG: uracil-DNA glycosylase [SAR116 cluster bacterium MED-G06]
MSANLSDRRSLIAQLAWQEAMGIDEVLLDRHDDDRSLSISDLIPAQAPAQGPSQQTSHPSRPVQTPPPAATSAPASAFIQPVSPPADSYGAVIPPELTAIESLDALRTAMADYDGCALKNTASNMIFADGNPAARVMVIGEVPGRDEDRVGLPLVGSAGQLFDRMLASIGLSRADTYITTLIPWRPPGNRTPTDEEMALLTPWLLRHIQLVNPERLLLLGGAPAKSLLPQAGGILKLRGRWHDLDAGDGTTRQAMVTLHPSYLIRSPAQKRLAYADLLALADKLG